MKKIKPFNGKTTCFICDVSDREDVRKKLELVKKEIGQIDNLINYSGIVSGKSFLENSGQEIGKNFFVNIVAIFGETRALFPEMVDKNCRHIITDASVSGIIITPRLIDYLSSKFADFGFDESVCSN